MLLTGPVALVYVWGSDLYCEVSIGAPYGFLKYELSPPHRVLVDVLPTRTIDACELDPSLTKALSFHFLSCITDCQTFLFF